MTVSPTTFNMASCGSEFRVLPGSHSRVRERIAPQQNGVLVGLTRALLVNVWPQNTPLVDDE